MSSRIGMSLEARASALVAFLEKGHHRLTLAAAKEICEQLQASSESPARHLKTALAASGIELKHTACLQAWARMEGHLSHALRPQSGWDVATYSITNPGINRDLKQHDNAASALSDLCTRLSSDLKDAGESAFCVASRGAYFLEFWFIGAPLEGRRYLLARWDAKGEPEALTEADILRVQSRVRKIVEGQFKGWLDGALFVEDVAARPQLLKDGQVVADQMDSRIASVFEQDLAFEADTFPAALFATGPYELREVTRTEGYVPPQSDWGPAIWGRLNAFHRLTGQKLSEFVRQRFAENRADMPKDDIDIDQLRQTLDKKGVHPDYAATFLELTADRWAEMSVKESASREELLKIATKLGCSANELRYRPQPAWRRVTNARSLSSWLTKFQLAEVEAWGNAKTNPVSKKYRDTLRKGDLTDGVRLEEVLAEIEAHDLLLCCSIGECFMADLPIPRERIATVGMVYLWEREEFEGRRSPVLEDINWDAEKGPMSPWGEPLHELNAVRVSLADMRALVKTMKFTTDKGWDSRTLTAAQLFGAQPDAMALARVAVARLEAMGELLATGEFQAYLGLSGVASIILEAAVRCPLMLSRGKLVFDRIEFGKLVLQFSVPD